MEQHTDTLAILDSLKWMIPLFIILFVWDAVWKIIALWKAGRNNELGWFICIALINSVGILPIVYLIYSRSKRKAAEAAAANTAS